LQLLGVVRRRLFEGRRRIRLAPRILHGVQPGLIAVHGNDGFAVAIDDHGGDGVALRRTGSDGRLGNGFGDVQ
jgi:hypothetical protein